LGTKTLIQYNEGVGGTNNSPVIVCNAVDNVQINDLTIDGGGANLVTTNPTPAVAGFDGISITNGTFVVVRNAWIRHCKNDGIVLLSTDPTITTSYGHRVEGCYIGENVHYGLSITSNGGIFTNNQITHNGYGIVLNSSGSNYGANINVISNNNVRLSLYHGIYLSAPSSAGDGVTKNIINQNIVFGCSQNANNISSNIILYGSKCLHNMIQANYSQQPSTGYLPKYAIEVDNANNYNYIQGNFIYNCGATDRIGATPLGAGSNRVTKNFVAVPASTYDN
jgi:hypothetical protein